MRVLVAADNLYERVTRGNHTPPGAAAIGQIKHMTPPDLAGELKEEKLLSSVYHANARHVQFYELSA